MRRVKAFLALGSEDKAAFFRSWRWLVRSKIYLALCGLARTVDRLVPGSPSPTRDEAWVRAAKWLPVATRYCPNGSHCLGRSIALIALLRRGGIAGELRIGVRKGPTAFEAHAWVEVDGIPVNDFRDVASHYSVFDPRHSGGRVDARFT